MIDEPAYEKFIQYGEFVEVVGYQLKPVVRSRFSQHTYRNNICIACGKKRYLRRRRNYSSSRAKKAFYRIVVSNLDPHSSVLGTFTMRDVVPLRDAYKLFRDFINRFRRRGFEFSYIAVPEFQKRGAVHFHVLFFNFPMHLHRSERSTRFIASLWTWGFVDLVLTDGSSKLATYLSKYMTKASQDTRLSGLKAYTTSRNIQRPFTIDTFKFPVVYDLAKTEAGVNNSVDPIVEHTYHTSWLGEGNYKLYHLKKK